MKEDNKDNKELLEKKLESQVVEVQSSSSKNANSGQELEEKAGKKKKKGLKKDIKSKEVEDIGEEFNVYAKGTMANAEKHRSATRPKRELNELTDEDQINHLCPCCGLPEVVPGKLEYYKTFDDPDEFSNCGQGVVLYYDYIIFVILIALISSVGMGCFNIYFSNKYYTEMTKVCNNYYHEVFQTMPDKSQYLKQCQYYMTDSDIEADGDYINKIDSFFFRFSSVNIKDYREIFKVMYPALGDSFESTIINLSLVNFIILVVLFIFNLIYIYFLFNKSNAADYLVFTVSDYAVFLTNLFDLYNIFKSNLKKAKEQIDDAKKEGKTIEEIYFIRKLGFYPKDDMSEIKMFETFLIEKIFRVRNKKTIIKDYGVNRIDFCYKSGEIIELQQKLSEINEKINKIDFDPNIQKENKKLGLEGAERNYYSYILPICPFTYCPKKESLKDIMEEKEKTEERMNQLIKDSKENLSDYFGGAAFITFNTTKQQEDYLSNLPNNFFSYIFDFFKKLAYLFCACCFDKNSTRYYKRNLAFESAPEPEDVIFENIETKPLVRILKTALVYFISIILCGISFAAIYGLNLLQMYVDEHQKNQTTHFVLLYVISFAITGVTSGMDVLLEIVLEILTKWEKQVTWTNYYLSFSLKLTLFSFVNSAILPTFCEFFINDSDGYEILISNMLMKFLVNAIVTPGMWTLNVGYFIKKIKIYFITRKGDENIDISQKELNELYEYPKMNVSAKYSYIAKTILMSFFYIPIFPLGIIISLLGFILGYWLEKYNFANMYKTPEMLSRQIVEFYTNYFVLVFFVYGIGDYIFLHECYENRTWSLVNIITFGVLIIFPYHQMLTFDYLHFEESSIHEEDYNTKYTDFLNDYERANPMTEKEGKLRFLEAKKAKGEIKEEEFNKQKNEIQNENPMEAFKGGFMGPPQHGGWGRRGFGHPHFGWPHGGFMPGTYFRRQEPNFEGGFPPHGGQGYYPHMGGFPHGGFPQGGYPSGGFPHGGYTGVGYNINNIVNGNDMMYLPSNANLN